MRNPKEVTPSTQYLFPAAPQALPLEIQLRIAEYVGWRSMGKAAATSKNFNFLWGILFLDIEKSTNIEFAKAYSNQYIQTANQLNKKTIPPFKTKEFGDACYKLLLKLYNAFMNANDKKLKSDLGKLFDRYAFRYLPVIVSIPDNIRVQFYRLTVYLINHHDDPNGRELMKKITTVVEHFEENDFKDKLSDHTEQKLLTLFEAGYSALIGILADYIRQNLLNSYKNIFNITRNYFTHESALLKIWLKYIDMQMLVLTHPQQYKESMYGERVGVLIEAKEFMEALEDPAHKNKVPNKILKVINQFISHAPQFDNEGDKDFYFRQFDRHLNEWKNIDKGANGCVLS